MGRQERIDEARAFNLARNLNIQGLAPGGEFTPAQYARLLEAARTPPRPGLVWKEETKRWIRPDKNKGGGREKKATAAGAAKAPKGRPSPSRPVSQEDREYTDDLIRRANLRHHMTRKELVQELDRVGRGEEAELVRSGNAMKTSDGRIGDARVPQRKIKKVASRAKATFRDVAASEKGNAKLSEAGKKKISKAIDDVQNNISNVIDTLDEDQLERVRSALERSGGSVTPSPAAQPAAATQPQATQPQASNDDAATLNAEKSRKARWETAKNVVRAGLVITCSLALWTAAAADLSRNPAVAIAAGWTLLGSFLTLGAWSLFDSISDHLAR